MLVRVQPGEQKTPSDLVKQVGGGFSVPQGSHLVATLNGFGAAERLSSASAAVADAVRAQRFELLGLQSDDAVNYATYHSFNARGTFSARDLSGESLPCASATAPCPYLR